MALWRDLINIPEHVHSSDFVLKLTEGVTQAEQTVGSYVVTRGVEQAFGQALGLIGGALSDKRSKGAYLHGSFGSGKSHFMAVLDLLLTPEHTAVVRKVDKLMPAIHKHTSWLDSKKLLMVPYHFLGAISMEERILGGYVEHVRALHPEAPLPGVYASEALVTNALNMRAQLGDEAFFKLLNREDDDAGGAESALDWFGGGWDAARFDASVEADHGTPARSELVGALVSKVFTSMQDMAATSEGAFVDLDIGLQIITQHAKSLGYDGLVLFLDELILWLSRKASDLDFIHREEQKLAKLVEAQHANRPIPIISFVARQRSLSEFVGDYYTGAEKSSFDLSLNWLEGRFDTINLEDRDLPLIAQERLLKPLSPLAAEQIRQSFERYIRRLSPRYKDLMRTRETDDEQFAKVYPFSPALVQSLVALSTFLQRERTALRMLLLLLVRHRDRLQLDQVVPVGDLWDVVTEGQQPFSDALRRTYQNAVELWEKKFRPLLVKEHNLDPLDAGVDVRRAQAWEDDARLIKTLLIAALVPQVEALKDMTVAKLTALNLSAVRTPLPNMEDHTVLRKLQLWAGEIGELRIYDEADDPRVQIQLTTLDPDILLDRVRQQDSIGARRKKIKTLLFEFMGIDSQQQSADYVRHKLVWRGMTRQVKIYYSNVRELTTSNLRASDGEWSLFLDYPFDEEGMTPKDDENKLTDFINSDQAQTETLAWLPMFLSVTGQQRLGRLVRVEYLLQRYDDYAQELPQQERPLMRQLLENISSSLRTQLKLTLETAYGLAPGNKLDTIDSSYAQVQHLYSLRHNHNPKLPAGKDFAGALEFLLHDALEAQYPELKALPHENLTPHNARKLFQVLRDSLSSGEPSIVVEDKALLTLCAQFAQPVELCTLKAGSNRVAHNLVWRDRIERVIGQVEEVQVATLQDLIDPPQAPKGYPPLLVELIICVYAANEQMEPVQLGATQELMPGKLDATMVLRRRKLPEVKTWEAALEATREMFGVRETFAIRDVRNVERMAAALRAVVEPLREMAHRHPSLIEDRAQRLGLELAQVREHRRYQDAVAFKRLIESLKGDGTAMIEALVKHTGESAAKAAFPTLLGNLSKIMQTLERVRWESFATTLQSGDAAPDAQRELLRAAQQVMLDSEHVQSSSKLAELEGRLFKLLIGSAQQPPQPPAPPAAGTKAATTAPPLETITLTQPAQLLEVLRQLEALLSEHPQGLELEVRATPSKEPR